MKATDEAPVLVVLTTFPNQDTARQIGSDLVESQLAACVNLLPGAESIYRWQGRVERESEVLALLKTTASRVEELTARLRERHPYEEPEIVALPVVSGSESYLDWVRESTAAAGG